MKRTLALTAVLALLLIAVAFWYAPSSEETYSLARIEIVDTPEARAHGLSGRSEIPEDFGMLFRFPVPASYGFWMKDMEAPIDIIWLADDGTILGIESSVAPETYPESFHPPHAVQLVLETRAGEAARKGWVVGTKLSLPKENRAIIADGPI